jgi:predicted amidohydrolase
MQKSVHIAAIQMTSTYGKVAANLVKAERLVSKAVENGAQLVVLPELFNSGYAYTPANYHMAETRQGKTFNWITRLAARLNIHLAGSVLLAKDEHIYNTLVLAAPDGQTWEYDKIHPWGWERAYFRPGRSPKIAHTSLGKIGLLICYDITDPKLLAAYAGEIQILVISSCPPKLNHVRVHFPDEPTIQAEKLSPINKMIQDSADLVFDEDLRAQSAWLGVPMINAMPHGDFASSVPHPKLSFAVAASTNPRLWPLIRKASDATISAPYNQHTMIADINGNILAHPPNGDTHIISKVAIPASPPTPTTTQPKMSLHPAARWMGNIFNWLMVSEYNRNRGQINPESRD